MHITIIKHKYANSLPGFMSAFPNYLKDAEEVESIIKRRENVILNSKHTASLRAQTPQTYIVVIGESLSRKHMSLYGYSRNTSSELVKIKSELLIFNNVISSSAQTQPSLSSALTEASSRGREEYNNALSMVDVANLAGYKTWWISNQQPMRAMIASISNMANVQHFISNDFHGVENNRYDGYMLPAIEKSLSDDAPHKVIFVHMLGSHIRYKHRFPKESAYFTNQKTEAYTDDLTEQQLDQINKYDNSVRYNDSVMSDIINLLKNEHKSENNGALINGLVMFCDHGEDVYDTRNFRGHAPDDRATKTMLEIPYIFWLSDSYQKMFPASYQTAKANTSVPYMLDDGFHTVLDLIGVDFDAYDAKSSIMSDQYEPKERIVYKKDYDKDQ
jgi:heptose-I-phosphate ethanolaminephosphotransferase